MHWLQEFHDFLNDLQDWERSMKEKDKNMGSQICEDEKSVSLYFIIIGIL